MPYTPFGKLPGAFRSSGETVDARNIRGGVITSQEIIIGSGGVIRSANYDGSSAGWAVKADGSADFYGNVTIGGTLTLSGDLTAGGDIDITGSLFASGSGTIATAETGARTELGSATAEYINMYSGASGELNPFYIRTYDLSNNPYTVIQSGYSSATLYSRIILNREDLTMFSALGDVELWTTGTSGSKIGFYTGVGKTETGHVDDEGVKMLDGSYTLPSYSFKDDPDTGFWRFGANEIGVAANGSPIGWLSTTAWELNSPLDAKTSRLVADVDGIDDRSLIGNAGMAANRTTTQSITTGTWTFVNVSTSEEQDDDAMHNNATDPERFTAPDAGWYAVSATLRWTGSGVSAGTNLRMILERNQTVAGAAWMSMTNMVAADQITRQTGADWPMHHATAVVYLAAAEWVSLSVYHDEGSNITVEKARLAGAKLF